METLIVNGFLEAAEKLKTMDKTKFNCVMKIDGEFVFGWMESTGASTAPVS